ncbi:unnamed protein product [Urochloa decumbens]|uniref:Uncharacterized protein n=1 Tax=Urochloa decumbens TaxID=240449 RepID=A0ABC9CY70_9POAL
MDFGFYKRARGIKHKAAAMPLYPRKPAQVAPAAAPTQKGAAGSKMKQSAAATTKWSMPAPPPSSTAAVAMEVGGGNGVVPSSGGGGSDDADVDRLAALYISRVQERLRRERMADDCRMYY